MATEDELRKTRLNKAERLRELGVPPYPNSFRTTPELEAKRREVVLLAADEDARAGLPLEDELAPDAPHLPLFGRVIAKRGPFLVIRTPYGEAQSLVRPDSLPEADAAQLKLLDLADHVLVEGPAIRTKTGALAISARTYQHLGKALLPPPAKWHGLKDVEKRYRERYVDLFANPAVAEVFRARTQMIQSFRRFLDERGFLEVETTTPSTSTSSFALPLSSTSNGCSWAASIASTKSAGPSATKVSARSTTPSSPSSSSTWRTRPTRT